MSILKCVQFAALWLVVASYNSLLAQNADQLPAETGRLVLRGGTVVDVRDGTLHPNTNVVLENDRIIAVTTESIAPEPLDRSLDVSGQFIIPGLKDAHLHY